MRSGPITVSRDIEDQLPRSPFVASISAEMYKALSLKLHVMLLESMEATLVKGGPEAVDTLSKQITGLQRKTYHSKIRFYMGILGYPISPTGMCEGIVMRGIEAFSSGQLTVLRARTLFLYSQLTDLTKSLQFQSLAALFTTSGGSTEATRPVEADDKKRLRDRLAAVREQLQSVQPFLDKQFTVLAGESKEYRKSAAYSKYLEYVADINAAFHSMILYQKPTLYAEILGAEVSQTDIRRIAPYAQSLALEEKISKEAAKLQSAERAHEEKQKPSATLKETGLTKVDNHVGVYTPTSARNLFLRVEKIALEKKMGDFTFALYSRNHVVGVAYQAPKPPERLLPTCKIIDANKIELLDVELTAAEAANHICSSDEAKVTSSFRKNVKDFPDEVALSSTYFCTPENTSLLQELIADLKKSDEYSVINNAASDKIITTTNAEGHVTREESLAKFSIIAGKDIALFANLIRLHYRRNNLEEVKQLVALGFTQAVTKSPILINILEVLLSPANGLELVPPTDQHPILNSTLVHVLKCSHSPERTRAFSILIIRYIEVLSTPDKQMEILSFHLEKILIDPAIQQRNELINIIISDVIRKFSPENQLLMIKNLVEKAIQRNLNLECRNLIVALINHGLRISSKTEKLNLIRFALDKCFRVTSNLQHNLLIVNLAKACLKLCPTMEDKTVELSSLLTLMINSSRGLPQKHFLTQAMTELLPLMADVTAGHAYQKRVLQEALCASVEKMSLDAIDIIIANMAILDRDDQKNILDTALATAYEVDRSVFNPVVIQKLIQPLLLLYTNPLKQLAILSSALEKIDAHSEVAIRFAEQRKKLIQQLSTIIIDDDCDTGIGIEPTTEIDIEEFTFNPFFVTSPKHKILDAVPVVQLAKDHRVR